MDEEGALACSENRTSLRILEFVFGIFEDDGTFIKASYLIT